MKMDIPRILITAGKSGTGKTMVTCGILEVLKRKGFQITAYKCGPDYIDPMFHREVLGIPGYNLDIFLCGRRMMRELLFCHSISGKGISEKKISGVEQGADHRISVIEGVMGYYDGLGGISYKASTYDVADATDTPSVMVVNCKGASVSLIPYIQGFLKYQDEKAENSHIQGVILNRISPAMYERLKALVENETSVRVYGYVPDIKDFRFESRYLGLKMPEEVEEIKEKLKKLGELLEESLDIDGLVKLAGSAPPLQTDGKGICSRRKSSVGKDSKAGKDEVISIREWTQDSLRIGVAMDEAFCFIYQDNLNILEGMGAEIIPFSPLHDAELPDRLDGIIFYGGYPELHTKKLSENQSMRKQIKQAVSEGMPCIAECGGFMFLMESIRDERGTAYPMCGVFGGESFPTSSLRRFGYVTLRGGKVFGRKDAGDILAHEFHYCDSERCGESFVAKKPLSDREWKCMISTDTILAGYPHIHYAGSPKVAEAFLDACSDYRRKKQGKVRVR